MAADAFTPRTTKQRLPTPLNGTLHTTTRMVAQEKPLPVIGGTMEAELGPAWADSIVIAVSEPPDKSQGVLTITHVRIPGEDAQLSANWEQVRVPIGGKQYPGVVRSVILLASDYLADSPALNSPLPVVAEGLFAGGGYLLYERECVKSGMELEPTFRVDRRTYVISDAHLGSEVVSQFGGGLAISTDSLELTNAEAVADAGALVLASSVTAIGNGQSIRQTLTYDGEEFPVLRGQDYNAELGLDLPFTEQVVAVDEGEDAALPAGADVSPIDQWRNKVRTPDLVAIQAALDAIHFVLPTQENVQLPDVLKSVSVLASRILSNGDSVSSGSSSMSCSSSVAVSADLTYEIEEGFSGSVPAEIHVFFLSQASAADVTAGILTTCNAAAWPIYRPLSHRLVIAGHGLSKSWKLASSGDGVAASEESGVAAFTNVGVIPACLHGEIHINPVYTDFDPITANVDEFLDTALDRVADRLDLQASACVVGNTVLGVYIDTEATRGKVLAIIQKNEALNNFRRDLDVEDFGVTVEPSMLAATSPAELVPGRYVVRSTASLYGYDRVKVTAVVADLTGLIP